MRKFLFLILLLAAQSAFAQDFERIANAFSAGNATEIGKMLDASVDYTVDGKESVLGRGDAENKLRSFFLEQPPRDYNMVHKGVSQNDVHYVIGELITSKGTYRVTVYLHKSGADYVIQSLDIEAQ